MKVSSIFQVSSTFGTAISIDLRCCAELLHRDLDHLLRMRHRIVGRFFVHLDDQLHELAGSSLIIFSAAPERIMFSDLSGVE